MNIGDLARMREQLFVDMRGIVAKCAEDDMDAVQIQVAGIVAYINSTPQTGRLSVVLSLAIIVGIMDGMITAAKKQAEEMH